MPPSKPPPESPAKAAASAPPDKSPLENFSHLTRRLLAVSRDELKEAQAREKRDKPPRQTG